MTYNVLMGTLNPTHSLTHSLLILLGWSMWSSFPEHHQCRSVHHQWSVGRTWCLAVASHDQTEWKL